jgi:hypothetical protein
MKSNINQFACGFEKYLKGNNVINLMNTEVKSNTN